jgi:arginyl-tRNA synthetase
MNIFNRFQEIVVLEVEEMAKAGDLPPGIDVGAVSVELPRDAVHGDLATNAALVLAKQAKCAPRDIAQPLAARLLGNSDIVLAEVAGPGFINLRLTDAFWHRELAEVLRAGAAYGDSDLGVGTAINVEYVSANPTGPLHVGHCRGAVFGDALANLLDKAGFKVAREYYVNDAGKGGQMEALARSIHFRYSQALGNTVGDMPDDLYPGDYLIGVAEDLAQRVGDKWLPRDDDKWSDKFAALGVEEMLKLIKKDLALLDIRFRDQEFHSERALHQGDKVEEAYKFLERRDLIYTGVLDPPQGMAIEDWEPRDQPLFRATQFGDDVDRPLKKSDGSWTYFAADIAYHWDKWRRGFANMIDVWGADHSGYVMRMKAAVTALSSGEASLDVKICNLVKVMNDGVPVRMSKRAGDFVTLSEVVDAVGKDVVRFIMLTRRNDAPLDFDLARATEQSKDNPVFYVQYAHARVRSLIRRAREEIPELDVTPACLAGADFSRLTQPAELALIKALTRWPHVVESAAVAHEPHRVAFYLAELAADFHGLWAKGNEADSLRFLVAGDARLTAARLALAQGAATVIASGLAVMGVAPAEEMR